MAEIIINVTVIVILRTSALWERNKKTIMLLASAALVVTGTYIVDFF